MALNFEYTLRETVTNLRRNVAMTTAAIITVAVSLSLVGAALLVGKAVDNATLSWRGGIEFAIYFNPDSTAGQRQAVQTELQNDPNVKRVTFVSQAEAYQEFKTMFQNNAEFIETVEPEVLPPSFRVVPNDTDDAAAIDALGRRFEKRPGVQAVVFAKETAAAILSFSRGLQLGIYVVAIVLLVASALLIVNTIRLAIYARRREIEVMKLVGATNWFIRVPFMLEGMVHGVVGAAVSVVALVGLYGWIEDKVVHSGNIFQTFVVGDGTIVAVSLVLFGIGAFIGAAGSGTAVTRFLDV